MEEWVKHLIKGDYMDTKKPWLSKTVWINAIMGIIATISIFVPGAHVISDFITNHAAGIAMIWSAANIGIRFITHDKVQLQD